MPRSRAVTPDHFTSKRGQVSAEAWKLLQAAECYADDAGLHPLDPAQFRAEAFPHHATITMEATRALVVELVDADLLVPYFGPDRRLYVFSRTFHEDQKPQNPSQARYPLPPFVTEEKEDKPGRTVYRYRSDPVALADYREGPGKGAVQYVYRTYRGQLGLYDSGAVSGTCSVQPGPVPYMYDVVKVSKGKEREEKGLDLDLPSSTYRTPSAPPKPKSTPVASDLVSKPEPQGRPDTPCLTDALFVVGVKTRLLPILGRPLSAGESKSLNAALAAHCAGEVWCGKMPQSSLLPGCRAVVDAALEFLPRLAGPEKSRSGRVSSPIELFADVLRNARLEMALRFVDAAKRAGIEAALPIEAAHAKEVSS